LVATCAIVNPEFSRVYPIMPPIGATDVPTLRSLGHSALRRTSLNSTPQQRPLRNYNGALK